MSEAMRKKRDVRKALCRNSMGGKYQHVIDLSHHGTFLAEVFSNNIF